MSTLVYWIFASAISGQPGQPLTSGQIHFPTQAICEAAAKKLKAEVEAEKIMFDAMMRTKDQKPIPVHGLRYTCLSRG